MVQVIKVEASVGMPLAHDITEIRPGEFKGPAFKRGHIIGEKDIDHLKRLGKDHLYVLKPGLDQMHEDDAVVEMANALCSEGVYWKGSPSEGKLGLLASMKGLLKIDVEALNRFNELGEVMCATLHNNSVVKKDQKVAGTRAIPLLIRRSVVAKASQAAGESKGVLRVLPFRKANVGVLITGNEVYYGRIKDKFEPIIRRKVAALDGEIAKVSFVPDDDEKISNAVHDLLASGADIIITTGGMSVDPDDRTRFALKKAGAENILYGSAVLPGAMFMVSYVKDVPVLGIPACGLHALATVFDLVYPRILADEILTRKDIAKLGHGGLCLKCEPCHYPKCPFGKGD